MTDSAHNPAFIVLAAPGAADALRALRLDPRPHGRWLRAETTDPEAARAALRPLDADWSVRRADAPPVRLFVSDMDSTVIGQECIDELADFAGRKAEIAAITERAMRGELDFAQALRARVAALKGQPETILDRCFRERVRPNAGAHALLAALEAAGADTALVSGGFDAIVDRVAADVGFRHSLANRLTVEDGALTGGLDGPIVGADAKAAMLGALARRAGIGMQDTAAMGDGANDLAMLRAAGFAIAVGDRPVVLAEADAAVRGGDLSVVIDMLNLTAS